MASSVKSTRHIYPSGTTASVEGISDPWEQRLVDHAFGRMCYVATTALGLWEKGKGSTLRKAGAPSQDFRSKIPGYHASHQSHMAGAKENSCSNIVSRTKKLGVLSPMGGAVLSHLTGRSTDELQEVILSGDFTPPKNLSIYPEQSRCDALEREFNLIIDKRLENQTRDRTAAIYTRVMRGEMRVREAIDTIADMVKKHFVLANRQCLARMKDVKEIHTSETRVFKMLSAYHNGNEINEKYLMQLLERISTLQMRLKTPLAGAPAVNVATRVSTLLQAKARGWNAARICEWSKGRTRFTRNPEGVTAMRERAYRELSRWAKANELQAKGTLIPKLESIVPKSKDEQIAASFRIMRGGTDTPKLARTSSFTSGMTTPFRSVERKNVTPDAPRIRPYVVPQVLNFE